MSKGWDPRAEEAPREDLRTGVGNPLSPYTDELLSPEDEKRIDDKGLKVVHGEPWSKVGTGEYLYIAVHSWESLGADRDRRGVAVVDLKQNNWRLELGVTSGKPKFLQPVIGACLEIPLDLGEDSLKRKYVAEWLRDTTWESLGIAQLKMSKDKSMDLGMAVAQGAQSAIGHVL